MGKNDSKSVYDFLSSAWDKVKISYSNSKIIIIIIIIIYEMTNHCVSRRNN